MSEWFYIWLALGITWITLGGVGLLLNQRRAAAERALRGVASRGEE